MMTYVKIKLASTQTLKLSYFQPPHKKGQLQSMHSNQVKVDPQRRSQVNFNDAHKDDSKFDAQ